VFAAVLLVALKPCGIDSLTSNILLSDDSQSSIFSDGVSCSDLAPFEVKRSPPRWAQQYNFTGPLRPTLYSSKRIVPPHIRRPDYADHYAGVSESERREKQGHSNIRIHTAKELEGEFGLRHACRMGREVLDVAGKALRPGVTGDEIDRIVHDATIERDWYVRRF
jgi:methionyl aminopeptidase